jgi:hypothetical protein
MSTESSPDIRSWRRALCQLPMYHDPHPFALLTCLRFRLWTMQLSIISTSYPSHLGSVIELGHSLRSAKLSRGRIQKTSSLQRRATRPLTKVLPTQRTKMKLSGSASPMGWGKLHSLPPATGPATAGIDSLPRARVSSLCGLKPPVVLLRKYPECDAQRQ